MPNYVYQCEHCLEIVELTRPMKYRNVPIECPTGCGHKCSRSMGLEMYSSKNAQWDNPVLSTRMGVSPSQVSEHRRLFPNIPITDTGEIIVTSSTEERRINKELEKAFLER